MRLKVVKLWFKFHRGHFRLQNPRFVQKIFGTKGMNFFLKSFLSLSMVRTARPHLSCSFRLHILIWFWKNGICLLCYPLLSERPHLSFSIWLHHVIIGFWHVKLGRTLFLYLSWGLDDIFYGRNWFFGVRNDAFGWI